MGSLSDASAAAAGAPCLNPEHYPDPVPVGPLTADFRLHDATDGEPCIDAPDAVSAPALRFWETSPITNKPRVRRKKRLYRTIVIDPPWEYRQRFRDPGKARSFWMSHRVAGRGAAASYDCMTQANLLNLPIGQWAAPSIHVYLWTTNQFMAEAHELMAAWGFEVKTILTWVKNGLRMGFYYRNNTEHVLFGARNQKTLRRDVGTAFYGDTQRRHSEKPAAFYDLVESMSPGPYLDVFARRHRFGWDVFGNEVYNEPELLDTLTDAQRQGLVGR